MGSYSDEDLCRIAASVIRSNRFITLATATPDGLPWIAPLMYAIGNDDCIYWVSAQDAIHSRHLVDNPNVAIVIFDSDPEYGKAQAVYISATASSISGDDLQVGCDVFYTARYPDPVQRAQKGRTPADFSDDSPRRMYRAKVAEYSILHPNKHPVYGSLIDHRVVIPFRSGMLSSG